jgi:uncharacterized protein YegL
MAKQGEGVKVSQRKLTVFFLLDRSGSMLGDRIAKLNQAIPVTIGALKDILEDRPDLRIVIKVIEFSDKAVLTFGQAGIDIMNFTWRDLEANGGTATASAINLLCDNLDLEIMPRRGYPPVAVLVSDGYCTERGAAYTAAIDRLNQEPWGKKAARIVVSIGDDIDEEALKRFVNDRGSYINCVNAEQIVDFVKLKTTEATLSNTEAVARPNKEAQEDDEQNAGNGPTEVDPDTVW